MQQNGYIKEMAHKSGVGNAERFCERMSGNNCGCEGGGGQIELTGLVPELNYGRFPLLVDHKSLFICEHLSEKCRRHQPQCDQYPRRFTRASRAASSFALLRLAAVARPYSVSMTILRWQLESRIQMEHFIRAEYSGLPNFLIS